jgi:O-antigen/teichoic acid export membrane protein
MSYGIRSGPADPVAAPAERPRETRGEKFFTNVLWSWFSVAVNLFSGVILTPYIIRKLGADGYGIWSLTFSLIGYYGLLDLGFRSAVIYYTSRYRTLGEVGRLNELINTLMLYFSGIALILFGITVPLSRYADRLFKIPAARRDDFTFLILIVGISLGLGIVFNVPSGLVEGFQRFDLANQIRTISAVLRYAGCAALLAFGFGLKEMGVLALATQLLLYYLYIVASRRIFPDLRFSFSFVRLSVLKQTARYGIHTFLAGAAVQSVEQTPSLLVGIFRPAAFVGYYNLPLRLLQYASEAISRIGIVAAPQAAEFAAQDKMGAVGALVISANRYSFALLAPFALVLLVYGREVLTRWVGADFSAYSAPLLPVFVAGTAFTTGQVASSSILFGIGKHQGYAYAMILEAACSAAGLALVLPRYGILGAAVVTSVLMVAVRGLLTPWLVCRQLRVKFPRFMLSIYLRPVLTALPVLGLIAWAKGYWPGRTWAQLIAVSFVTASLYLVAAFFTCLEPDHRRILRAWVFRRWRRGQRAGEAAARG